MFFKFFKKLNVKAYVQNVSDKYFMFYLLPISLIGILFFLNFIIVAIFGLIISLPLIFLVLYVNNKREEKQKQKQEKELSDLNKYF